MRFKAVLLLIVIVATLLAVSSCSQREMEYYGKQYAEEAETLLRTKELSDDDPAVREKAAYRLIEVAESNDEEMLAALMKLAESDASDPVRIAAFAALQRFGYNQAGAWETAMNAMGDENDAIREAASDCAAGFARREYGIKPPYEEWLKDPNPEIRKNALLGFRDYYRMDERPDELTNAIINALTDEDAGIRMAAAGTLVDWGIETEKTTALYIEMLQNPLEASSAAFNMSDIEPPPVEAIPHLLKLFYDRQPSIDIEELVGDGRAVSEIERELKKDYPDSYLYARVVKDKPDHIDVRKKYSTDDPGVFFVWDNGREDEVLNWDQESILPRFALYSAADIDVNEDVLAAMMVGLSDKSSYMRRTTLSTVTFNSGGTLPLLPRLIEMAQSDPDLNIRTDAISDLGYYAGRAPDMVVPILIKALDDETTRNAALEGISEAGAAAAEAIPVLKAMDAAANGESEFNYETSANAWTIITLEIASGKGLQFIGELLSSENERIRRIAAEQLNEFGEDALPYIVQCLKDESFDVRGSAAWSLGHIGEEYPSAIPYMTEALKHEDTGVVFRTLSLLGYDREWPVETIPILIEILGEINLSTGKIERPGIGLYQEGEAMLMAYRSITALGDFGPVAAEAVPALARLVGSDNREIYERTLTALEQIGAASVKALPELRTALTSESQQKLAMAAHVIGIIGPGASDAAGDLIKLLADENPGVRREAATSLGLVGLNSADVQSALGDAALNDINIVVRKAAGMAIEKIEGEADA